MVWASFVQMELIKEEITEREAGQRGWKRKEGRFCFLFITVANHLSAVCPKSAGVIVNVQSRPIATTLLLQTAHRLNTVWGGNKCMLALIRTWRQNKEFIRDVSVRVWTHAFNQTSEQLLPPPPRTALLHSSRRGRLIWSLQFVSLTGCQASVWFHSVVVTKTNRHKFCLYDQEPSAQVPKPALPPMSAWLASRLSQSPQTSSKSNYGGDKMYLPL